MPGKVQLYSSIMPMRLTLFPASYLDVQISKRADAVMARHSRLRPGIRLIIRAYRKWLGNMRTSLIINTVSRVSHTMLILSPTYDKITFL